MDLRKWIGISVWLLPVLWIVVPLIWSLGSIQAFFLPPGFGEGTLNSLAISVISSFVSAAAGLALGYGLEIEAGRQSRSQHAWASLLLVPLLWDGLGSAALVRAASLQLGIGADVLSGYSGLLIIVAYFSWVYGLVMGYIIWQARSLRKDCDDEFVRNFQLNGEDRALLLEIPSLRWQVPAIFICCFLRTLNDYSFGKLAIGSSRGAGTHLFGTLLDEQYKGLLSYGLASAISANIIVVVPWLLVAVGIGASVALGFMVLLRRAGRVLGRLLDFRLKPAIAILTLVICPIVGLLICVAPTAAGFGFLANLGKFVPAMAFATFAVSILALTAAAAADWIGKTRPGTGRIFLVLLLMSLAIPSAMISEAGIIIGQYVPRNSHFSMVVIWVVAQATRHYSLIAAFAMVRFIAVRSSEVEVFDSTHPSAFQIVGSFYGRRDLLLLWTLVLIAASLVWNEVSLTMALGEDLGAPAEIILPLLQKRADYGQVTLISIVSLVLASGAALSWSLVSTGLVELQRGRSR